mgnify:CR=1 FL=1
MNLYSCETSQGHYIVAESMIEAIKVYEKNYGEFPDHLKKISGYVLVQDTPLQIK